jgi:hypothetical protein
MTFNRTKLEAIAKEAKAKTNDRRWHAAIDRAVDALVNNKWIITELFHCIAVTTESGKTYRANGHCQCEAFFRDQPCKHRAAARLIAIYNETPDDGRTSLIASIKSTWSAKFPTVNLADELMRRFCVNSLNFLADDMLAGVLTAIA